MWLHLWADTLSYSYSEYTTGYSVNKAKKISCWRNTLVAMCWLIYPHSFLNEVQICHLRKLVNHSNISSANNHSNLVSKRRSSRGDSCCDWEPPSRQSRSWFTTYHTQLWIKWEKKKQLFNPLRLQVEDGYLETFGNTILVPQKTAVRLRPLPGVLSLSLNRRFDHRPFPTHMHAQVTSNVCIDAPTGDVISMGRTNPAPTERGD